MKIKDIALAYLIWWIGIKSPYFVFALLVFARFIEGKIRDAILSWKLRGINDKRG